VLVCGLLAMAALAGCSRSATPPKLDAPGEALHVTIGQVQRKRLPATQAIAGVVRPEARATVAAKITGVIVTADLHVGRAVKAGEVVATLQAAELGARASQAHAALAQVERELARERSMESQGASTQESVREAEDRRRQAQAAADEADAMLGYTRVTAPFDGVITEESARVGDLATPGRALFSLEGTDHLLAEVPVPESLRPVPIGGPVTLLADDNRVSGELVALSPAGDPVSRTRLAKIAIPDNAAVRSGQFVRALWPAGETDALTVPSAAVSVLGQFERVFVVSDGRAHLRIIRTGGSSAGNTVVNSGLEAGENVVVAPPATLRDGQSVTVSP
jgi:RND family efflux transporter MFP subunit